MRRKDEGLPPEAKSEIERSVDAFFRAIHKEYGISLPASSRQAMIRRLQGREQKFLNAKQRVESCPGFAALCDLGCDGEEILRHVYGLIGLEEDTVPRWEHAVNLDRDKLNAFAARAWTLAADFEYLLFPAGEELLPETIRQQLDRIPDVIRLGVSTLVKLNKDLDERKHRGPADADKSRVLGLIKYVRSTCPQKLPYKHLADVLTQALGDDVSEGSLRHLLRRNSKTV
jgi:hypothetical protein